MSSRIQINPQICHGKPVIRGTRVLVSNILAALGSGDSIDDMLQDYPDITREDIQAALIFASQISQYEELPYEIFSQ